MEFINKVELSGTIETIRKSERGSNFVMVKQIVKYGDIEKMKLFEVLINPERKDLIDQIAVGKNIRVYGSLTIFRMQKFPIHKMLIEANKIESLE